jgi:hypothetical protein
MYIREYLEGKGYCGSFDLDLLDFFQEPDFPATRVHLTVTLILKNRLLVALLQQVFSL